MRGVRTRLRPTAFLWAAGYGMLGAHWLDYLLVYDDAHVRAHVLDTSGHGYESSARLAALAGLALLLAWTAARAVSARRPERLHSPAGAVVMLSAAQSALFVAVEIGERLAAGVSPGELLHDSLLPIGLALQPVVAAALVACVLGVERLGARLAPPALRLPALVVPRLDAAWALSHSIGSPRPAPRRGRAPPGIG